MEVVVYGRSVPVCSECVSVKDFLDSVGVSYEYKDTSNDAIFEEFMSKRLRGIPSVMVDGKFIGVGLTAAKKLLEV